MVTGQLKELQLASGAAVQFQEQSYIIEDVLSLTEVSIRHTGTLQKMIVRVSELQSPHDEHLPVKPDLPSIAEQQWQIAKARLAIIMPLLENIGRAKKDVQMEADKHGLGIATIYRWLSLYESNGVLTSLLPAGRSDKRKTRLVQGVDDIVSQIIEQEYLTAQKKPRREVVRNVVEQCRAKGLKAPHKSTVYRRIKGLAERTVLAGREGKRAAAKRFSAIRGSFPGANHPLAVVQIDHTQLDIILVDDTHRTPIGRPWITLAIDVYSRMVLGLYISFDPPGAISVGMCLVHAILPKDRWLTARSIAGQWPCWGLPVTVHADNAREFRGVMLKRASQEYGVNLEWRPVARPNYGAHIERLLGTLLTEIHTLPGTTFSNPGKRGTYPSEKNASFTLSEFETWLGNYIVGVYHQRKHSSIDMPPLAKYHQGILGDKNMPGRGLPARIADEERLKLDLLPPIHRTIQNYGVSIDEVRYYSDVLRPWINALAPENSSRKRRFVFRRDPRDISVIWFFDPELMRYFPVTYRDNTLPPISIWEFREARRIAKEAGAEHVDEHAIFQAYQRMREIEENAGKQTKAMRRAQQRRLEHRKDRAAIPAPDLTTDAPQDEADLPDIQPFDEMREL